MALKDMVGTLKEKAEELESAAKGEVIKGLDEYKQAIAVLETFGFSVGSFTVGMGVFPEIHTSITGSIENVREEGLKQIIADHQGDKLLVSLLDALITARRLWEHVELKLKTVTIDLTLGVPPKVAVEMH